MEKPVLLVQGLVKRYGGIQALGGVDFEVVPGEIHALCGENGAGKSTLVKILGGLEAPQEGTVTIDGVAIDFGQRTDPRLLSIVHQELSIIPHISVLDNVMIGDPRVGEIYIRARYRAEARHRLDEIGLGHVPLDAPASGLTLAEQQLLEICRAMMRGAKILILDEPTASLSDAEIQHVFKAVRWLRDQGTAIIYISHRLPEIFELTDRVTVFRNGQRILTKPTSAWTNEELVAQMIGRAIQPAHSVPAQDLRQRPVVLELRGFEIPGRLRPVDLTVRAGEIVGVVGQLGSGGNALVEALAGLEPRYRGEILFEGASRDLRSIPAAMAAGIGYVSEDRAGKSLFLGAPIEVNLTSAILAELQSAGVLRFGTARSVAQDLARRFQVDVRRLPLPVNSMSGGNQQKVAIAKTVAQKPRLLLLNEPTRGVDVGARSEIYRELKALAAQGLAVVYFSTDLEELRELSYRIVTVFRGRIVRDMAVENTSMEGILADILRGSAENAEAAA